jgi:hypothetical protein
VAADDLTFVGQAFYAAEFCRVCPLLPPQPPRYLELDEANPPPHGIRAVGDARFVVQGQHQLVRGREGTRILIEHSGRNEVFAGQLLYPSLV